MNLSGRKIRKVRVPVGVVAFSLLALALSSESGASTGPGWSQNPSWASSPDSPSPRRSNYGSDSRFAITPYAPGSNNLAIDVGQVFLMGDLGNQYSDNIGGQLHYTYGVSDLFAFDSSVGYSSHSDGKFSMGTLLTGLRTNLSWYDKVIPYLVFGLGFYKPSYTFAASNGSTSTLSPVLFGVHIGPGVDLELTKQLFFGASLTFHDVFGSKQQTPTGTNFDAGGTYTSFLLHAGVTF